MAAGVPAEVLESLRPADADEDLVAVAREQVFTDRAVSRSLSANLAFLWPNGGSIRRRRDSLGRLFSKSAVASKYGLPADSGVVWLSYPRLTLDLLRKLWKAGRKLRRGGRDLRYLTRFAKRRARLYEWLKWERPE